MPDLVLIKWADAHDGGIHGWTDLDTYEDDGECIITTVGLMIPADEPGGKKDHVSVWQTIAGRDAIHPFHIPVGMVRTMTVICVVDVD